MTSSDPPTQPAPGPARRGDLPARLATAAVGIPILLTVIWAGGPLYTLVAAILLGIGAYEILHAARRRASDLDTLIASAATALMAPAAYVSAAMLPVVLTTLVMLLLAGLALRAKIEDAFARWAAVVAAVVYAGLLGSHLVLLRQLDDGRAWVLLMVFTTFATDTGAFFVGRALGRHKLSPRVSPGKTVEGAVGGLVTATAACVALNVVLGLERPIWVMLGLGGAIAVAGEAGDLGESLIKRSLGVKDMGRLFPGHGGALDRLDSILFVAPLVYYAVRAGL